MGHQHSVYDVDTHFKIDPVSRKMTSEAGAKTTLMQYDHNSERFTFELPRYVEGHDMTLSTKAEVHYLNVSTANKADQTAGVYEVEDLQISPAAEDVVIFSWLISQNATKFAGPLFFIVRFVCCDEDGNLVYVWSTDKYENITISDGIYNSEIIVEQYVDVLAQWEQRLFEADDSILEGIRAEGAKQIEAVKAAGENFTGCTKEEVETLIAEAGTAVDGEINPLLIEGATVENFYNPDTAEVVNDRQIYATVGGKANFIKDNSDKYMYFKVKLFSGKTYKTNLNYVYSAAVFENDDFTLTDKGTYEQTDTIAVSFSQANGIDNTIFKVSENDHNGNPLNKIVTAYVTCYKSSYNTVDGNVIIVEDEDGKIITGKELYRIFYPWLYVPEEKEDEKVDNKINAFKEFIEISPNVFNKDSEVEDGYYNSKGIYDNTSGAAKTVKTLNVKNQGYDKLTVSHMWSYHTFWDANGDFISGVQNNVLGQVYTIDNIPQNTDVIKITVSTITDVSTFMAVEGATLPEFYVPYGYYDPYNINMSNGSGTQSLQNKKIMFFGDSITDPNSTKYVHNLISYSGMINVGNFALSGATLTSKIEANNLDGNPPREYGDNNTIPNQVKKLLNNVSSYDTPDIILIFAGVNDNVTSSGTATVDYIEEEFTKSVDDCNLLNFSGAMRWVFEKLATTYPNALIVFATPYQVKSNASKLKERVQAITENCTRLSVDCIKSYAKSGICDIFETAGANGKYLIDGLHHNADGGIKFAKFIHNELQNLVYKIY